MNPLPGMIIGFHFFFDRDNFTFINISLTKYNIWHLLQYITKEISVEILLIIVMGICLITFVLLLLTLSDMCKMLKLMISLNDTQDDMVLLIKESHEANKKHTSILHTDIKNSEESVNRALLDLWKQETAKPIKPNNWDNVKRVFDRPSRNEVNE